MEGPLSVRGGRGRGGLMHEGPGGRGRPHSRNKHWSPADGGSTAHTPNNLNNERWERGGYRGGGRGRGFPRGGVPKFHNVSLRLNNTTKQSASPSSEPQPTSQLVQEEGVDMQEEDQGIDDQEGDMDDDDGSAHLIQEPELDSAEEREKFYQELVKARESERKRAIAEGKMDDPLVPKRLEDAITIVGTCLDMCPRFERYRRERENNLFEWETIPGTKRVDHNRAVKMYERAAGDKTLPSDLRPPSVLKRTLNYLFHDLLPRGGFTPTFNFIRDRSRSVRNDFTMQHLTGPLAMECHDRCARFHILALHFQRDVSGFSIPLEEQQLMNTLQSLKEFYEDQRGRYQSPTELEMRVYHRLIHIRDQRERHDDIPEHILSDSIFKLTTEFRLHVQKHSAPISKTSKLVVTQEGMQIFGQLANTLNEQGSTVMVYLVACILERLFGKDTIDDIEALKGGLDIPDIIDGVSTSVYIPNANGDEGQAIQQGGEDDGMDDGYEDDLGVEEVVYEDEAQEEITAPTAIKPSATEWLSNNFAPTQTSSSAPATTSITPATGGAFAGLVAQPNVFGNSNVFGTTNFFGNSAFSTSPPKPTTSSVFGTSSAGSTNVFGSGAFMGSNGSVPSSTAAQVSTFARPSAAQPPQTSTFNSTQPSNVFGVNVTSTSPQPASQIAPTPPKATGLFSTPPAPGPLAPQPTLPASSFEVAFPATSNPGTPAHSNATPSLNPKAPAFTPPSATSSTAFPSFKPTGSPSSIAFKSPQPPNGGLTMPPASSAPSTSAQLSSVFRQNSFTKPPLVPSPLSTGFTKPPTPPEIASPQLNRPRAPSLPKINTSTSSQSTASPAVDSPRIPPPAPKIDPVSLPATPSTSFIHPLVGHLKSSLEPRGLSPWGSSQEILSPLIMSTPTGSNAKIFPNFSPFSTPQHSGIFRAPSSSPPAKSNGKGKAPDRSMYDDLKEVEEMKKRAQSFARKSDVVKRCFSRWMKKAAERGAWREAVRHGDEYKKKIKTQNQVQSRQSSMLRSSLTRPATPPVDKKRRISLNGLEVSPSKKRAKKRISVEYRAPRTDDELAQRFKENHADQEQRWAHGSFLTVIRGYVQTLQPSLSNLPWEVWVSLNPESDATAIWLERKFSMPDSGSWISDSVFSIPLSSTRPSSSSSFPGLVVFECTPLGDVADDLEKKYRVLDDCGRLRQLIKSLPAQRHFIPSLLIIDWSEQALTISSDIFDMAKRLVNESTCLSAQVFGMTATSKDLDSKLISILKALKLDTEGMLVKYLTSRALFKIFEPHFISFVDEWMENCTLNMRSNWSLYGQVIQASVAILNVLAKLVHILMDISNPLNPLSDFDPLLIEDSESTYEDVMSWLSSLDSGSEARMIAMDIQAYRNIGQDFPMRIFIDHLLEMTQARLDSLDPALTSSRHPVLKANIDLALETFEEESEPFKMKLLQTYNFTMRRSPKRRSDSITTSTQNSPIAKRPRLSESTASSVIDDHPTPMTSESNDDRSPSPASTVAASLADGPPVTVAMLRALTKDLKKKYMGT